MSILIGFLYVIEVAVCLLLVLVVMLQKPKDGGVGGAFGGASLEAALGADAGNVLIKATTTLGIVFLLNTLLLACLCNRQMHANDAGKQQIAAPAGEQAPAPQK